MKTAVFFLACAVVALAGALVVVWNRPVPPPAIDEQQFQTIIDLELAPVFRADGRILERVTVGTAERRDDGFVEIPFTVTFAVPKETRDGYALFRHGWHVIGFADAQPPPSGKPPRDP